MEARCLAGLASWICPATFRHFQMREKDEKEQNAIESTCLPSHDLRRTELDVELSVPLFLRYTLGGAIGKGAYGSVLSAKCKRTQEACAVKSIPIDTYERDCQHELAISWRLVHPCIVRVFEVFQDNTHVHIVMERCEGGSLHRRVKTNGGLAESLVMKYAWQMWSGIGYMHHHGFVHRDVKPANYLFADGSDDARLKLIDMGFATPYERGIPLTARVGTVECSAPEVIQGSYDAKCDIWSIGIVLYYCCVSYCPFNGPSAEEILLKILREDVQFPPQDWKVVGPMTRKIIFEMLTKDVAARPSAQQLSARYAGVLAPVVEELSSMFESSPAQAPLNDKQVDYGSYRTPSQESLQTGSSAETTASSAKDLRNSRNSSREPVRASSKEFTRAPSKESLSSENSSKECTRSSWSKRRLSWPHKLISNQVRRVTRLSARISTRSLQMPSPPSSAIAGA